MYLKRVTSHAPDDADAWVELAELYAERDQEEAREVRHHDLMMLLMMGWRLSGWLIEAYEMAVKLMRRRGTGEVPREIINNLGVVHHMCGQHTEALAMYDEVC